jgi:hypothetical protein
VIRISYPFIGEEFYAKPPTLINNLFMLNFILFFCPFPYNKKKKRKEENYNGYFPLLILRVKKTEAFKNAFKKFVKNSLFSN